MHSKKLNLMNPWLVAVAAIFFLAGCGNDQPRTAQIELNNRELSSLVDPSRPIEAYYLSKDTARMAVQLVALKEQISSYLRSDNADFKKHIMFPEINNEGDTRNAALKTALADIDTMRANIDLEWDQHLDRELAPLRLELEAANKDLAKAVELRDLFKAYTHGHQTALNEIEANIETNRQRFRDLQLLVVADWDQYILDNELPIRRLNNNTRGVYTYSSSRGQCYKNRGLVLIVDRLDTDDLCYYLRVPHQKLLNPEASKLYLDNFSTILQLDKELGAANNAEKSSLRAQLIEARALHRDTIIKAENQFGRKSNINHALNQATSKVNRIQSRIDNASAPLAKRNFTDRLERDAKRQLNELMESYLISMSSEVFSKFDKHEVQLSSPFELKKDASMLLISIPVDSFWGGFRHALIFVNLDTLLELHDEPLIITPSQRNNVIIPEGYYQQRVVDSLGEFILDDIFKGNSTQAW